MIEPAQSPSCSILITHLQSGSLPFPFSCILDTSHPPPFFLSSPRLITSGPFTTLGLYWKHYSSDQFSRLSSPVPQAFLHDRFHLVIFNISVYNRSSFVLISKHQTSCHEQRFCYRLMELPVKSFNLGYFAGSAIRYSTSCVILTTEVHSFTILKLEI